MNKIYTADISSKNFAPALIANGMAGIRPGLNPLKAGACIVPGFISENESGEETQTPAPYPFVCKVMMGDEDVTQNASPVSQKLDMNTGKLESVVSYTDSAGKTACITSVITALRRPATVMCMHLTIDSGDVKIKVYPAYENDESRNGLKYVFSDKERSIDTYSCETKVGRLGISIGISRKSDREYYCAACMLSGYYNSRPALESKRITAFVLMSGIEKEIANNDEAWHELWKSAPVIDGPEWAQKASDEAYFYLTESTNPASQLGVACYAQSNAYALQGQIFWDMDFYVTPALALLQPETAKALERYRSARLDEAKKLAGAYGYSGAMYPWQSGLYGTEETVSWCATGWAEQHIGGDVAVSMWELANVCDDNEFIENDVWPVLKNIADWIATRGTFTERGYEIDDIMGVDEGNAGNKNNLFCNVIFRMSLKAAIDCAAKLGKQVPEIWKRIWKEMFLARADDGRLLVNEGMQLVSDDRLTYSPGMMQFLWVHAPEIYGAAETGDFEKLYRFEEDIRKKLPADPSNPASATSPGFTTPPIALSAAFFGDKKKAEELIKQSYAAYLSEPYAVLKEYAAFSDGEYITGHASFMEHVILGFTGMRLAYENLACYPACLPEGWKKITLPRIQYRGRYYRAEAVDGEKAVLTEISDF